MTLVRLEPAAPRSRVKHSTTEPLRSLTADEIYGLTSNLSNKTVICTGIMLDIGLGRPRKRACRFRDHLGMTFLLTGTLNINPCCTDELFHLV